LEQDDAESLNWHFPHNPERGAILNKSRAARQPQRRRPAPTEEFPVP